MIGYAFVCCYSRHFYIWGLASLVSRPLADDLYTVFLYCLCPSCSLFPTSVGVKSILYPTILPLFVGLVGPCRMLLYTLRGDILGSLYVLQPTHTLIFFLWLAFSFSAPFILLPSLFCSVSISTYDSVLLLNRCTRNEKCFLFLKSLPILERTLIESPSISSKWEKFTFHKEASLQNVNQSFIFII